MSFSAINFQSAFRISPVELLKIDFIWIYGHLLIRLSWSECFGLVTYVQECHVGEKVQNHFLPKELHSIDWNVQIVCKIDDLSHKSVYFFLLVNMFYMGDKLINFWTTQFLTVLLIIAPNCFVTHVVSTCLPSQSWKCTGGCDVAEVAWTRM